MLKEATYQSTERGNSHNSLAYARKLGSTAFNFTFYSWGGFFNIFF